MDRQVGRCKEQKTERQGGRLAERETSLDRKTGSWTDRKTVARNRRQKDKVADWQNTEGTSHAGRHSNKKQNGGHECRATD